MTGNGWQSARLDEVEETVCVSVTVAVPSPPPPHPARTPTLSTRETTPMDPVFSFMRRTLARRNQSSIQAIFERSSPPTDSI